MIGTVAAKPVLERLTDVQYRRWATYIITAIASVILRTGAICWRSPPSEEEPCRRPSSR